MAAPRNSARSVATAATSAGESEADGRGTGEIFAGQFWGKREAVTMPSLAARYWISIAMAFGPEQDPSRRISRLRAAKDVGGEDCRGRCRRPRRRTRGRSTTTFRCRWKLGRKPRREGAARGSGTVSPVAVAPIGLKTLRQLHSCLRSANLSFWRDALRNGPSLSVQRHSPKFRPAILGIPNLVDLGQTKSEGSRACQQGDKGTAAAESSGQLSEGHFSLGGPEEHPVTISRWRERLSVAPASVRICCRNWLLLRRRW